MLALLILANSHHAFAKGWDKARDLAVDQELSEMKSASAILAPGKHAGGTLHPKTGQISGQSPSDAGGTAKGSGPGISGGADSGGSSGTNLGSENTGAENNVDSNLNTGTGTGGTEGSTDAIDNSGDSGPSDSDTSTDLAEETPTVGGDVSTGGEYLISADASVGETEVSADLIPSDSLDDTIIGQTTDIGAEIDASGELSGSEAEIGIEADVDGSVSGDTITEDPADGLSTLPSL